MKAEGSRKIFNIIVSVVCTFLCCISLCACSYGFSADSDKSSRTAEAESLEDTLKSYVENKYGIADNVLYGRRTTHVTGTEGVKSYSYETTLDDSSNSGAVFYKVAGTEEYPNNFVCAYISDEYQEGNIQLVFSRYKDYKEQSGGISFPLKWEWSDSKSRCYVAVVNDLLVCITMEEGTPVSAVSAEDKEYNEEIIVYDMSDDFDSSDELFTISRKLSYRSREFKDYSIEEGDQRIRYSAGYDYYNETEDERVTTQQEFCDRANNLLAENSINFIT